MADSTTSAEKKRILIVDDDEFLLDMYATKFREAGFEVDIAAEGRTAKEKIKKHKHNAILLDIVMPELDGFALLRDLRKENEDLDKTLVIYLTNLGQREDIEKGLALGVDDYIIKAHFTPTEVVKKVEELLEKKKKS